MTIRPSLFQRPLVALLCAQLLLSACSATEIAPGAARWPAPAPQPEPANFPSPQWPANVIARTVPNFEAPSATHCARPVQSYETPGRTGQRDEAYTGHGEGRGPLGREAKSRRAAPAEAASDAAVAMPAPSSPAAGAAGEALAAEAEAPRFAPPAPGTPPIQRPRPQQQVVTAGMVDDNADFSAYLQFRQRTQVAHRARDVS